MTYQSEGLKSAAEVAKQIITLSTGAVAFTVTFLEKFTTGHPPSAALYFTWACLARR